MELQRVGHDWATEQQLVTQTVKNLPAIQKIWVQSLSQEDPLEKGMATHCSILAGEVHGQGSLAGYSPWDGKEPDMTEWLTLYAIGDFTKRKNDLKSRWSI